MRSQTSHLPAQKLPKGTLPWAAMVGSLPPQALKKINTAALVLMQPARALFDFCRASIVEPRRGCVLYAPLAFRDAAEHSGIYIGSGKIVSLSGSGKVVCERPDKFKEAPSGIKTAQTLGGVVNIYISCRDGEPIGDEEVAKRAEQCIGQKRDYSLLDKNCHRFSLECLSGDLKGDDALGWTFSNLSLMTNLLLDCDSWEPWNLSKHARRRREEIQRFCEETIPQLIADRERLQGLLDKDFAAREKQLDAAFADMRDAHRHEDFDRFVQALGEINQLYGEMLPWRDFQEFDEWMLDDSTALKL